MLWPLCLRCSVGQGQPHAIFGPWRTDPGRWEAPEGLSSPFSYSSQSPAHLLGTVMGRRGPLRGLGRHGCGRGLHSPRAIAPPQSQEAAELMPVQSKYLVNTCCVLGLALCLGVLRTLPQAVGSPRGHLRGPGAGGAAKMLSSPPQWPALGCPPALGSHTTVSPLPSLCPGPAHDPASRLLPFRHPVSPTVSLCCCSPSE